MVKLKYHEADEIFDFMYDIMAEVECMEEESCPCCRARKVIEFLRKGGAIEPGSSLKDYCIETLHGPCEVQAADTHHATELAKDTGLKVMSVTEKEDHK